MRLPWIGRLLTDGKCGVDEALVSLSSRVQVLESSNKYTQSPSSRSVSSKVFMFSFAVPHYFSGLGLKSSVLSYMFAHIHAFQTEISIILSFLFFGGY